MIHAGDLWLEPFRQQIPAGTAGLDFIDQIPTKVMGSGAGRTNSQRERYCLVAVLRWLLKNRPSLFPAVIERTAMNQSPDFILQPASGSVPIAIEHVDAGHRMFHRWMDRLRPGEAWPPLSSRRAFLGDLPKTRFVRQVAIATCRKRTAKTWRHASNDSIRAIVIYDKTSTRDWVDDDEVRDLLEAARGLSGWPSNTNEALFLIREPHRVFVMGGLA